MSVDRKRLNDIIGVFAGKRIAVIGDLILDVYLWGKADRISQEAPVPVVNIRKKTHSLGGASNVMRNLVSLGAEVYAFGTIGKDDNADLIIDLLTSKGINVEGIVATDSKITTEKQRLIAGTQQLVRIDYEDTSPIDQAVLDEILLRVMEMIKNGNVDAVILEDYAKGLLNREMVQEIVTACRNAGVVVALDPHPGHLIDVKGFSLVTPNRTEAFALAGKYCYDAVLPVEEDQALMDVANVLKELWEPEQLLITLGPQGMVLFHEQNMKAIPTKAREVFDVSGAGDTVIAAYVLALLGGACSAEAAEIANHAGGIVVGKVGTVSVQLDELLQSFPREGR